MKTQVNRRNECPGCGHKKRMSDLEIEQLISEQLMLEVDLVTEAMRDERLAICANCSELLGYTCLKCGCFAMFRASLSSKHCPLNLW